MTNSTKYGLRGLSQSWRGFLPLSELDLLSVCIWIRPLPFAVSPSPKAGFRVSFSCSEVFCSSLQFGEGLSCLLLQILGAAACGLCCGLTSDLERVVSGLPEILPSFYMVILKEATPFTLDYEDWF